MYLNPELAGREPSRTILDSIADYTLESMDRLSTYVQITKQIRQGNQGVQSQESRDFAQHAMARMTWEPVQMLVNAGCSVVLTREPENVLPADFFVEKVEGINPEEDRWQVLASHRGTEMLPSRTAMIFVPTQVIADAIRASS